MKNILTIFKKELKRFLTDKRMLITLLLPGVLIFCVYSLMGSFMDGTINGEEPGEEYTVYIDNQPDGFEAFDTASEEYTIKVLKDDEASAEEKRQALSEGKADLYIVYEEDFLNKILVYDATSGEQAPQVKMYYDSSSVDSQIIYSYYYACLDAFEQSLANKFDVNAGTEKYDVADENAMLTKILTYMIPMLLNILLFSGCMAVCTEAMAGEKERGTIATLLVTPVKRSHLALGKVFALALVSLISATSSFLGLIFSLPNLIGTEINSVPYGFGDYLIIFAIIIVTVLLFTLLLSIVSTLAKSVKEANGYAVPIMVLVMLLSISSSLFNVGGIAGYFIPLFNTVLCLTSIISMSFNLAGFFVTLGVDAAVFALGVFVLAKMFNSEKIMFNK